MAEEEGQPAGKIDEDDLRTMCMVQLLFKRKCMLYSDLKQACKEILRSSSSARLQTSSATVMLRQLDSVCIPVTVQTRS